MREPILNGIEPPRFARRNARAARHSPLEPPCRAALAGGAKFSSAKRASKGVTIAPPAQCAGNNLYSQQYNKYYSNFEYCFCEYIMLLYGQVNTNKGICKISPNGLKGHGWKLV